MPPARVPLSTKLTYGFGSVAYGVNDSGLSFFLLLYYNQVLGLPERWVGAGILAALLLDAISDPLVGHVSDRLHSRFGRRHPFMVASAVPIAVTWFFLWNPPGGLSDGGLFLYFLAMTVLVRTLITLYEVPCAALAPELTSHYDERTSILSIRAFFGWSGGLAMAALTFAVFLRPDANHPVGTLNPDGYRTFALVGAAVMLLSIGICALGTRRYIPSLGKPPPKRPLKLRRAAGELRETLSNRSFLALFTAAIFRAAGVGLSTALNVYFATFFWELGSKEIAILVGGQFVSAGIALAIAPRLSVRFGKKQVAIATGLAIAFLHPAAIVLRLLGWFPENGSPALLPTLWILRVTEFAAIIIAMIHLTSMLADVVEDSEVATGRRSEGTLLAASTFVAKSVSGVGVLLSTVVLALAAFPEGAEPGAIDPSILESLALLYVPTIVVLYGASVTFLFGYRIDRERHRTNLARLAARG